MKTTMRAILTDLTSEQKALIDNLMIVFGTAIRYSFKRLLEGKNIGDLEYTVSHKYNLNIRQSKDAIESARQTIASQIELINMYHENWTKKVDTIQKKLKNPKLSEKQIKAHLPTSHLWLKIHVHKTMQKPNNQARMAGSSQQPLLQSRG